MLHKSSSCLSSRQTAAYNRSHTELCTLTTRSDRPPVPGAQVAVDAVAAAEVTPAVPRIRSIAITTRLGASSTNAITLLFLHMAITISFKNTWAIRPCAMRQLERDLVTWLPPFVTSIDFPGTAFSHNCSFSAEDILILAVFRRGEEKVKGVGGTMPYMRTWTRKKIARVIFILWEPSHEGRNSHK